MTYTTASGPRRASPAPYTLDGPHRAARRRRAGLRLVLVLAACIVATACIVAGR